MTTVTRVIIVEAAHQATANALAHVLDPDTGGADTFRIPYPLGTEGEPTHYVCSAPFSPEAAALLDNPDAGPLYAALEQMAVDRGRELTPTLSEAQACRDAMVVRAGPL